MDPIYKLMNNILLSGLCYHDLVGANEECDILMFLTYVYLQPGICMKKSWYWFELSVVVYIHMKECSKPLQCSSFGWA